MFNSGRVDSRRICSNAAFCLLAATGTSAVLFFAGCGGAPAPPAAKDSTSNNSPVPPAPLPTASLGNRTAEQPVKSAEATARTAAPADSISQPTTTDSGLPKKGSAEWLLGQIIVLLNEPLPKAASPQEQAENLRDRNRKLVDMAHEVIGKTFKDESQEPLFNRAVQFLCEARLQLATNGSQDDAKALVDDAKALYDRDPNSAAAEKAAFAVARLANINARTLGKPQPRLIQEFAIQARLFANRFPKAEAHAIQLLSAAGQTCELHHLDAEAVTCFAMLRENYPQNPQSEHAAAVLRRLELKGKPLLLGGETRDKGRVDIQQFRGRPVLVVFWSSDSERFQELLPQLRKVIRSFGKSDLAIIGVCLDETEATMDAYINEHRLNWTQIFFSDPAKRQWDNPVVRYYGVHDIPTVWLVDAQGVVVDTHVTPDSLAGKLKYLLAQKASESRN